MITRSQRFMTPKCLHYSLNGNYNTLIQSFDISLVKMVSSNTSVNKETTSPKTFLHPTGYHVIPKLYKAPSFDSLITRLQRTGTVKIYTAISFIYDSMIANITRINI